MEIPSLPDIVDLITLICVWLFLRPQQAENEAIHASIDRLSASMDKLSNELQASREDRAKINEKLKTLFTNQDEMKDDIEDLRDKMLECRRGDGVCSKN